MNSSPHTECEMTSNQPKSTLFERPSEMKLPWEHGSEFHLSENIRQDRPYSSPWDGKGLLFGTGRDAMKAILLFCMASRGWKRLWVPAYFCQEVVGAIAETGMTLQSYSSWFPGSSGGNKSPEFMIGDVILVVNHFGLFSSPEFDVSKASAVIEDHTHDPWSAWAFKSKADYCVASLRKTLPVPDGGALWSPKQKELPTQSPLTRQHRLAAERKLEAMRMKALYLNDQIADKSGYRALQLAGDETLSGRDISAISEWTEQNMCGFPVRKWREVRKRNHETLRWALSSLKWVQVVCPEMMMEIVPFSCILLFDTAERREFVRLELIQASIYPAILWSLEEPALRDIPREHSDASRRMLSIHCDMRYSERDMLHVADCIERFGNEFRG